MSTAEKHMRSQMVRNRKLKLNDFFYFINFFFIKFNYKLIFSTIFAFIFSFINIILITSVYNKLTIIFFQEPKLINFSSKKLNFVNEYYLQILEDKFIFLFAIIILFYLLVSVILNFINVTIGNNILYYFRIKLINNIFSASASELYKVVDSKISYVYIATISRIKAFPNYFTRIIYSVIILLFLFTQMIVISLNLTTLLFFLSIIFLFLVFFIQRSLQKYHLKFISDENFINSYIHEIQNSIFIFKQVLKKKFFLKEIYKILTNSILQLRKYTILSTISLNVTVLIFYSVIIMFFASISFEKNYEIKNIFLFSVLALAATKMIINIAENLRGLIEVYMNFRITNENINFKKSAPYKNSLDIKKVNSLNIKDVSIKYKDQKKNLINNLNLNFNQSKMYAFVGKSGEGKTSVLNVLAGFLKNTKGSIYINKRNVNSFNRFKFINYVTQDPLILRGTLLENLTLFSRVKNIQKINKVLKIVDFYGVKKLETNFDSKGTNLSGGQKQKIAIARSLLSDAKIFLFDEIFSNIDTKSEIKILKNLKKLNKNNIMIFITHNLRTLKYFDKIVFFEKGKVKVFNSLNDFIKKN